MYDAFISYSHTADNEFAPLLQTALEKYAKPWYKIRNLNIFRDESNLSATPHLWNNITKAIDNSKYFIYLASPASAKSHWVEKEIAHWLESNPTDSILIVLTDGDIPWDFEKGTFSAPETNALPRILEEKFSDVPFYIDLRDSKTAGELDLKFPLFRKHILKLAAQLHNMPPKDLAGEEVRQHQKMIRIRNLAVTLLALLFISATAAAIYANSQKKLAEDNFKQAEEARVKASANFLIAEAQLERNPTKALEIACKAYNKNKDSIILSRAFKIYENNNVYISIPLEEGIHFPFEVRFMADNSFITHHLAKNESMGNDSPISDTISTLKTKTEERFVLRNLQGVVLKQYPNSYVKTFDSLVNADGDKKHFRVNYSDDKFFLRSGNRLVKTIDFYQYGAKEKASFVSPDDTKIVSIWNDGIIRIWDIETEFVSVYETGGLPALKPDLYKRIVSVSEDGRHMLVSTAKELQHWDLSNKGLINSVALREDEFVDCLDFSAKDDALLFRTTKGAKYEWKYFSSEINLGPELSFECPDRPRSEDIVSTSIGNRGRLVSVNLSSSGYSGTLIAYEPIDSVYQMPGSKRLLTISKDTLRLYNAVGATAGKSTSLLPELKMVKNDPKDDFRQAVFSKDETKMLVSFIDYDEGELIYELWNLKSGERICNFPSIFGLYSSNDPRIMFSDDGNKILITYGNRLTMWNCPVPLLKNRAFNFDY